MSHVVALSLKIKSLSCLKIAAEQLGLEFMEGQTTYRWYGKWVQDYHADDAAYKQGFDPADYGKCSHALRVKGCPEAYEVGIVASKTEPGTWDLIYDFYGRAGQLMKDKIGEGAANIRQPYAVVVAKAAAIRKGFRVVETRQQDGSIRLEAMKR